MKEGNKEKGVLMKNEKPNIGNLYALTKSRVGKKSLNLLQKAIAERWDLIIFVLKGGSKL